MALIMQPANVIKVRLGVENGGPIQAFFTAECAKAMDKYVPFDEGNLAGTVIENGEPTSNVGTSTIIYTQPYARYVYYGISKKGKPLKYHTDKHKLATSYWDQHMWTAHGDDIIKRVQKMVDRGGR